MSKEHMNYLRRKTADEAELWAADRIEELEREVERLNRIKSRTRQAELQAENDALLADIARLREALERIRDEPAESDTCDGIEPHVVASEALAATPEQSLARLRNQAIEKCAVELDGHWDMAAGIIRAMREPE